MLNEYEPRRFMNLLQRLLCTIPETWRACSFKEDITAWERRVNEYEAETEHQLEGPTMIATVSKFAPRELQAWVSNAVAYAEGDWDAFKAYLEMRYCNICKKVGLSSRKGLFVRMYR